MMLRTLALLLAIATPAAAQVAGPARVVDGDSIVVGGQMVRLEGLDAPEWDQVCHRAGHAYRCGLAAKDALRALIAERPVNCRGVPQADGSVRDRYGRLLGVCTVGGVEINGWLVERGHALNFDRYGMRYKEHEARAQGSRRGIWAGPFMRPEDWRAAKRSER